MINNKKVMLPILFSDILVLISYFIYVYLPKSDFANDVSRPGMSAVYVFCIAPALCLISAAVSVVLFKKSAKLIGSCLNSYLGIAAAGATTVFYIICFVLELLFLISQFSLGFLAPSSGTVYGTYANIILSGSLIHLVLWTAMLLKLNKVKK